MLSTNHLPSSIDRVKEFLTRYFHAAGMDLIVHTELDDVPPPDGPILLVRFTGPDVPLLLDRRADLLNSLEHLAAKLLGLAPEQHHHLRFDADNYKSGRDQQLQIAAQQAIDEVTRSGHPFRLDPMNSRERRLVHLLISNAGLRSASTGEGPFRSITVSSATPPEPPNPETPTPQTPNLDPRLDRLRKSFRRR